MRRLGRILRRVATALSALLLVATLGVWVRGLRAWDGTYVAREALDDTGWRQRSLNLCWCGGDIGVVYFSAQATAAAARDYRQSDGAWWEADLHSDERGTVRGHPARVSLTWSRSIARHRAVRPDYSGPWEHAGILLAIHRDQFYTVGILGSRVQPMTFRQCALVREHAGMTQREFNALLRNHPEWFRIETRRLNASHIGEQQ